MNHRYKVNLLNINDQRLQTIEVFTEFENTESISEAVYNCVSDNWTIQQTKLIWSDDF